MTIATSNNAKVARGNGSTVAFAYNFLVPSQDDLSVTYISLTGAQTVLLPSQYSVTGIGNPAGGVIGYPLAGSPIAAGTTLIIKRIVPYTQPTSLIGQGGYFPEVVESALDNLEMQIQQAVGAIGTGIHYPSVDVSPVSELPPAAARAGKFFGFDGNGDPAMLTGSMVSGDLLNYTIGGMHFSNTLMATQNLLEVDAGFYVNYTSALPDIIYGFASNVYRSAGTGTQYTVGAQFSGYAMSGVSSGTFGVVTQAIGYAGSSGDLIGGELAIANMAHNSTAGKVGLNIVFKDRLDGETTVAGGLGSNEYNLHATGLWFTSQTRSTAGELCGFRRGIDFGEYGLDADANGGAIGIDFARLHYYGGSDPLTAYRMTAAIRFRDLQSILWNGDPTLANDPTEPANPIRTYFNPFTSPNGRWILSNTGAEKFGIDVVTGAIYVNGVLTTGATLSGNNTWTGLNTYSANMTIGANLIFTGARRIQADWSSALASRTLLQTSVANSPTYVGVIPNGSAVEAGIDLITAAGLTNCRLGHIAINNTQMSIQSAIIGAVAYVPLTFYASATEGFRLDTSNRVLIGTAVAPTAGVLLRVNGMVQIDNAAAFYAHRNGVDQVAVPDTTATQVVFTTVAFDQASAFNAGTSTWTPPAGKYAISAGVGVSAGVSGKTYRVLLYKNGAAFKNNSEHASSTAAANATVSCTVDANGTDFFQVFFYQDTGGAIALAGGQENTWFSGHRVG